MNKLSFNIENSADLFSKLKQEYSELINDQTSSRYALNCAMTAWHLTEWVYHEYNYKSKFPKLGDFQESLKLKCDSLQIMHDISNGSKHYKLSRHMPKVSDTTVHEGTFDHTFDFTFDTSRLEITMDDGRTLIFTIEIENVINFWDDFLNNINSTGGR